MQKNMDFFDEFDRLEKEVWQGLVEYRENSHLSEKKEEEYENKNRQKIRRIK